MSESDLPIPDPQETPPPDPQPVDPRDRITVNETFYHQPFGEDAICVDSQFTHYVEGTEQPYIRRTTVTEEWKPLDTGWLEDNVGFILLQNHPPKFLHREPSEEERQLAFEKVLQIMLGSEDENVLLVPPGQNFRGFPKHVSRVQVRCQRGTSKVTIHAYPK